MRRRNWRPERAVHVADALDDLLADMEDDLEHPLVTVPAVLLPHSSGIIAIDKVCDGGLLPGTVTVLDCPLPSLARALLYSSARATDVTTLLSVEEVKECARWLLAGAAAVPAGLIRVPHIASSEWEAISATIESLAKRQLSLTEASSVMGIGHLIHQHDPAIVIIEDPDRFGPAVEMLESFVGLADSSRVAILTAVRSFPTLVDWVRDKIVQVTVVPHALGSRAALLTTDCGEGLTATEVEIATLAGRVTDVAT